MAVQYDSHVLVVGAGPVGLMMAAELARHGVTCRIVEKASGPSQQCKALVVQSRTMEIFAQIGILDQAISSGLLVRGANFYREGVRVQRFEIDPTPTEDVPYPFVLSLEQSQTERILGDYLKRMGRQVEWEVELLGFEQDKDGVTAVLRHSSGREELMCAQYIIGCDGAHSMVRRALGLQFEGSAYPQTFVLADVEITWPLAESESHRFLSREHGLVVWPIRGENRFYLSREEDEALSQSAGEERGVEHGSLDAELRAEPALAEVQALVDISVPGGTVLRDPRWISRYRISRRIVQHYRRGRGFIAGDAAHIHPPTGGQGMNTGIQDAYNLGWKLALVLSGAGQPALLESYHAERHPIGRSVLDMTDRAFRDWTQGSRERPNPEQARRQMINQFTQLDVNYRLSPIVASYPLPTGETPVNLQAGDRAPDGRVNMWSGESRRLFECLRGKAHHLLLFLGQSLTADEQEQIQTAASHVSARYGGQIVPHWIVQGGSDAEIDVEPESLLIDKGGKLHDTYGAAHASLYLVRPDGHLGFCGATRYANEFISYLKTILV